MPGQVRQGGEGLAALFAGELNSSGIVNDLPFTLVGQQVFLAEEGDAAEGALELSAVQYVVLQPQAGAECLLASEVR